MHFYILTLFPEMIEHVLSTSIIGRAVQNGYLHIQAVNIRDFTADKHKKVDDYPYGGGAGMVMQAQPVYDAWRFVCTQIGFVPARPRTIYLTPQAPVFSQGMAKELAREDHLVFLCGHYEGIDERVLEEIVTDYVSIGDYVLTGGELLEYPQYSRPEEWNGKKVPPILLSGNHAKVDEWRREQSILRTKSRRPDLLAQAELTDKERERYV